jgi:glutamate-1-semialdehyde aminotransferase
VFDEITSGWRINNGGAHLKFGIDPDIAVFGKGLGNGYPMTAVIGCREVMETAQETFISSTYWTDRVGPTAAIATINKMKASKVIDHLVATGQKVQASWRDLALKHSIDIEVSGMPSLSHFSFNAPHPLALKTLFTQMMIDKGYLATTAFYASYAHKTGIVDNYLNAVDEVFQAMGKMIRDNSVEEHLRSPVCHSGFKRLT